MNACMFPGQGAQRKGMGGPLFDEFAELVDTADRILGYSIRELCLEDPRGELNQTQYTQPALYVVNALTYLKRQRNGGVPPAALIGHSLGEFNALLAAEVFDFATGLRLVQRRGALMSEAMGGAMAAVMNVAPDVLRQILRDHDLAGIDLANFNAPSQIVVSGLRGDIERAQAVFVELNKAFVPLNTSGAFHSRYMRDAAERFGAVLADVAFAAPKVPVISNYAAQPYGRADVLVNLTNQLSNPVRWTEGIEYLLGLGEVAFEEIGGGNTLTNLVAKIKQGRRDARGPEPAATPSAPQVSPAQPGPSPAVSAAEKARRWNARYRIGTRVRAAVIKGPVMATKSEAVVLFGHRAAVYLEGYNGYFDLDEIHALDH